MALLHHKDKVSTNHIPIDPAFSILSKLSLKSVKRFSCVNKSWALLFETTDFVSVFGKNFISKHHSLYDDTCLLMKHRTPDLESQGAIYMISGERFEKKVKLDLPLPFQNDDIYIEISCSGINGIICLYQAEDHKTIVLWNPTTKEFKVVPPIHVDSTSNVVNFTTIHGFGFDSVTDDYKVIQHVELQYYRFDVYQGAMQRKSEKLWMIYSLRSNSWRKLDFDMPCRYIECVDVYMNGMCHWWVLTRKEEYMVSFDLSNEVFRITPLPLDMYDCLGFVEVERHLAVINMSISLITNFSKKSTFEIFVLGEIGFMESWTKLFIVGPLFDVEHPIGMGNKGEIFFQKENDELAYFDLNTKIIEEIGIQGEFCQIVIYKEDLLHAGRIN